MHWIHFAAEELQLRLELAISTLQVDRPNEECGWESDDSKFQSQIIRRCWVNFLVNLEGQVVSDRLRFTNNLEGEMMPAEWRKCLERVEYDDLYFQHYYGNDGIGEQRCE